MTRSLLFAALLALGPLAGAGWAAPAPGRAEDRKAEVDAVTALRTQLRTAETAAAPLLQKRRALIAEADRLALAIDAQKHRPEGVRRDLHLQELLSDSKKATDELERVQSALRGGAPALAELRRRLVRAIDLVIDHDNAAANGRGLRLPEGQRFDLERTRTAAVAALATPATPLSIAGANTAPAIDPLDGPRELRDKADLLRDSVDKLHHEAQRLAMRIDSAERRRRLRERAGAVDEDLFGEASSNRRVARSTSDGNGPALPAVGASPPAGAPTNGLTPTQGIPGAQTTSSPSSSVAQHSEATVLRDLVDPDTLDELRNADAIDDVERQARALKKAQSELESLAGELDRRAKALDGRAESLKRQK